MRTRSRSAGATAGLVVVGGGTAGIVAAQTAALLGARVTMIEQAPAPGGDCLWTGCVPSKTLIAAARAGQAFDQAMESVRTAIHSIAPVDSIESMERSGIEVVTGRARLVAADRLEVDGRTVAFRRCVVATGSRPAVPDLPGLAGPAAYRTTDSIWELTAPPGRLLVLGGGSIGCELAQAFARLGSVVTLVEREPSLLGSEDPDAAEIVADALRADGVALRSGRGVLSVRDRQAELDDGDVIAFDEILIATGRRARTDDLGLEAAAVSRTATGEIVVDDHLRTSNPQIWAAGDVTGHPRFTHVAGMHGSVAAANAVLGLRRRASAVPVPRVTFTDPEVASIGLAPVAADRRRGQQVQTLEHVEIDRAITDSATTGFTKLVVGRRGRLLGAVVVSPRAGETIGEATLAIHSGLTTADLTSVTHPYPTYSDGLWNAAIDHYRAGLSTPGVRRLLRLVRRVRR